MNHTTQNRPVDLNTWRASPQIEVVIEVPRGSIFKRGSAGDLDFVSPFPCPFNYGSVHEYVGLDGDFLDALVLGPRLPRGTRIAVKALGAVGLTDRDLYDDKLVCSPQPLSRWQRIMVVQFFHFYARCKRLLNFWRGRPGRTFCEGWCDATDAIERAHPNDGIVELRPKLPF